MNRQELKKAFEENVITEEVYKNELFKIELSKEKKKRKPQRIYERVTDEDFIKILKEYNRRKLYKHKIILLLAYDSGLRLQEILNLKPEDINVKERKIHVRQGKGRKDRITLLSKKFKESYKQYLPFNISKVGVQAMFLRITKKIGINKIIDTYTLKSGKTRNIYRYHFHSLRHSFASNCLNKGIPLNVVQEFLGHKNISTTGRYTKLTGEDAINIAIKEGL